MNSLSFAKPSELRFDNERLEVAYKMLDQWTSGECPVIPGAAILVGKKEKVLEPRFFGFQNPGSSAERIRRDGIFLLASITKPIVYLSAMKLVEKGLLSLVDPVTYYIPEFSAHHKAETLILHLFTHTSGLPDMLEDDIELRRRHAPLSRFIHGAIHDTQLLFRPGSDLRYQSMGTLIVSEIIQRISGTTIHDFIRQEVFDPLGMCSTALGSASLDKNRLVAVETPSYQDGGDFGWNSSYWRELGVPWGGCFSTPEDLGIICQLMLNGGCNNGVRILSPSSVEVMSTNRLDTLPDLPESIARTQPWGIGWQLNHSGTTHSWGDLLGRKVYGHTGATGTMLWVDPQRDGFCVILTTAELTHSRHRLIRLSNIIASSFR